MLEKNNMKILTNVFKTYDKQFKVDFFLRFMYSTHINIKKQRFQPKKNCVTCGRSMLPFLSRYKRLIYFL